MAKWHYTIESNQRIKEYNHKNGKHDYLIRDIVKIEENGNGRFKKEYYQNGNINFILNLMFSIILFLLFLLHGLNNIPTINSNEPINIILANSLNIAGIMLPTAYSHPIAGFLSRFFLFGKHGNKKYIFISIYIISFIISFALYKIGIFLYSNCFFCVIGLLFTWIFT